MQATVSTSIPVSTRSRAFERLAGVCGIVTGISSLLYAVFFLLVKGALHDLLPPLLLATGGLLATTVIVALYQRVRAADETFAFWAVALGILGQMGAAIHGVYGLFGVLHPSATAVTLATTANQLDPAGFLAFGAVGVSVFVMAWLILRGSALSPRLGYLGLLLGILLVELFLGALIVNDNSSLFILVPGGLASLLATPAWNIWLGAVYLSDGAAAPRQTP